MPARGTRMPPWWKRLILADKGTQTDQGTVVDMSTQCNIAVIVADKSTQCDPDEFGADRVPKYKGWS